MLPFTVSELEAAVENGDVTKRSHPDLPLFIYNYSPEVQYSKKWNSVTLNCRGLILDDNYNIVARPWKKFFNLGEVELPMQFDDPVEIMDKADGSLGILYPLKSIVYSGHHDYAIATRGSFESEQAKFASALWKNRYDGLHPRQGYTFLFEIIYPSNRIVLDYGDQEELVLLGAVENETGYYIGPEQASQMFYIYVNGKLTYCNYLGPRIQVFDYNSISEALSHMDRDNAEGYVIRSHNFMVKLKQPDYLDLHRLVTNASPKTVWEQLASGKSKSEIISAFPDEFHSYIESMIDPLIRDYDVRLDEIVRGFWRARGAVELGSLDGPLPTRKDYARGFSKHKDAKYYFLLLDERSIRDTLWAELKPKVEVNARGESDN